MEAWRRLLSGYRVVGRPAILTATSGEVDLCPLWSFHKMVTNGLGGGEGVAREEGGGAVFPAHLQWDFGGDMADARAAPPPRPGTKWCLVTNWSQQWSGDETDHNMV